MAFFNAGPKGVQKHHGRGRGSTTTTTTTTMTTRNDASNSNSCRTFNMKNPILLPIIMMVCIAVTSQMNSLNFNSSNNNGHQIIGEGQRYNKQNTVRHHYDTSHYLASRTNTNASRNNSTSSSSSVTSIIEEIVPPSLLPVYAPQNLQWNVTRNMLRQSRPVVGNTERLHLYLEKLQSGTCTHVLFMGGSVTNGHNAGGALNAYPQLFMDWLNAQYPCNSGKHEYAKTQASESITAFSYWTSIAEVERFDLVFIEYNIGDSFIHTLPHALEDKGPTGATYEYQGSWYFEVLLRRMLLLRKPDPVAIVTFNADYIGRIWATFPPWSDPVTARKELFRKNQEPLKIWVSSMYEVPVFSAVIWMLPLASKRGMEMQFNQTMNPYSTDTYHSDACCHPGRAGHLILSLVLAHCLLEEENTMLTFNEFDKADDERDFTMDDIPIMRQPLYLSPEEDEMYVMSNATHGGADFTDSSKGEDSWKDLIAANEGWTWYADNKDKDKYGYIANHNNTLGGQHIAISLSGEKHGRVEVSYVISYENFGISLAWLDESVENHHKQGLCNVASDGYKRDTPVQPLSAIGTDKVSVPKVVLIDEGLAEGQSKYLHICLTPRGEDTKQKGTLNKFKLLGVRVY